MNKKNRRRGHGPNKNMIGVISIILWALVITLIINYTFSSYNTSKTVEIPYSEFKQMILRDEVAKVDLYSNKYVITLKEGVTPGWSEEYLATLTEEEVSRLNGKGSGGLSIPGVSNQENSYFCAPLNDLEIIALMDERAVVYDTPYQEELSPVMSFLMSWVLPMVAMMAVFYFFSRRMGGGMGGLGGVGKANAKVYVEKKTGVTFNDVAGQDEAKESMQEDRKSTRLNSSHVC